MSDNTSLAADMLYGAEAIAEFLGLNRRQVFHFAAIGQLPVVRLGSMLTASKTTLRRHFLQNAAGSAD
jgi:hypothetical protein